MEEKDIEYKVEDIEYKVDGVHNISIYEPPKINCSIHGETQYVFSLDTDDGVIGKYCFMCFNDFLSTVLTNFNEDNKK